MLKSIDADKATKWKKIEIKTQGDVKALGKGSRQ